MAKNENSNFSYMTRRIGGTTYKVKVVFSDTEKETMEDKILRMIRNETVTTGGTCGIIDSPQMSRQPERSASWSGSSSISSFLYMRSSLSLPWCRSV